MLTIRTDVIRPQVNATAIPRVSAKAADDIALSLKNYAKIALARSTKIVTGKTLKSIEVERVLDSASRGEFRRNVKGSRSWFFIVNGRKAGGKMPVTRVAGVTKRGGAVFQPVKELLDWFLALNIPRARWFPILKKIARNGIKPVDLTKRTIDLARPRINEIVEAAARQLAKELIGQS